MSFDVAVAAAPLLLCSTFLEMVEIAERRISWLTRISVYFYQEEEFAACHS